ncbi:MAG: hypothetical protein ACI9G1_002502 [Pirellulaceae bacterium]|jgi:hypothetical protein
MRIDSQPSVVAVNGHSNALPQFEWPFYLRHCIAVTRNWMAVTRMTRSCRGDDL